jgi:hypothetical protein
MGTLIYGNDVARVPVEDRLLLHLQVVIFAKLRRQESFAFTWTDEPGTGDGHGAVWMSPNVAVYFKYSGSRDAKIDRDWVDALMSAANSPQGLRPLPPPGS